MYWIITLSVSIGGSLLLWAILSAKWNRVAHTNDPVGRTLYSQLISSVRAMEYWLPGDPGYLDLKFSVLRHAFVFGVSAVILRFVGYGFWESVIAWANLLYALIPANRYRSRKRMLGLTAAENRRDLREHPEDAEGFREVLRLHEALIRDSFVVVPYGFICWASLYLLMLYK